MITLFVDSIEGNILREIKKKITFSFLVFIFLHYLCKVFEVNRESIP